MSLKGIVPQEAECANLLVPVCLSSSHVAYGSIRMKPVFMILGQSAGLAAWIAIQDGVAVQKVDVEVVGLGDDDIRARHGSGSAAQRLSENWSVDLQSARQYEQMPGIKKISPP